MELTWNEQGLLPAIVQDASTGQVLMLAYMNEESLRLTQFSVDRAGDAIVWMGPDARLLDVNQASCRALGCARHAKLERSSSLWHHTGEPSRWRTTRVAPLVTVFEV